MLTEKCRNQEAVIDELEMRDQEYAELGGEADLLRQQVGEEVAGVGVG